MRYILKRLNAGTVQETGALQQLLHANDARLIDGSMLPHMAMVETDVQNLPQLQAKLGEEWTVFPEKQYSVPDTRRKIKK